MRGLPPWIVLLCLVAAAVLPYARSVGHEFVFDDVGAILVHPGVAQGDLGQVWKLPYWSDRPRGGLYRPLTTTTYAIDHAVGSGRPAAFHATNLLLHALATLAAYALLRALFPSRPGLSGASALLFAVHPIHVEPVAWAVGRAEILAALFVLLSYRLWIVAERDGGKRWRWAPPLLWGLSLLSKESLAIFPAILIAHRRGWIAPVSASKRLRRADALWPLAAAIVLLLRFQALGATLSPRPTWFDNPLAHVGPLERALGACGVLARQLLQVVTLRGFAAEYAYAQVAPGAALYATGAIMLCLLAAGAVVTLRWGRRSPAGWGFLFFLCAWLVTSNLVLPIGTVQADRLFYLPLLGLLVTACAGASRLAFLARDRRRATALACVAAAVCAAAAWAQTGAWKDQPTLFRASIDAAPRNVKMRAHLATLVLGRKTPESAREALALIAPVREAGAAYGPLLQREAEARMVLGEMERARELYRSALALGADSTDILIELGNIAITREEGEEALAAFEAAARTGRKPQHAAIGRASALSVLGRYAESAEAWRPILAELPDSIPVRRACAWNLRMAGRDEEAREVLSASPAAREDPRIAEDLRELERVPRDAPER